MNVQKDCIRMNSDNGRIVVYFSTQLLVDFSLRSWCLDIYISRTTVLVHWVKEALSATSHTHILHIHSSGCFS